MLCVLSSTKYSLSLSLCVCVCSRFRSKLSPEHTGVGFLDYRILPDLSRCATHCYKSNRDRKNPEHSKQAEGGRIGLEFFSAIASSEVETIEEKRSSFGPMGRRVNPTGQ
jgi:hypothetical protein